MAYASIEDMIQRFGEGELVSVSSDLDSDGTTMDVVRINALLEQASSLMDSYLQRKYEVPVQSTNPLIVLTCCDLARYDLAIGLGNAPSEAIKYGHRRAMAWLDDLGKGNATLDVTVKTDQSNTWSHYESRPVDLRSERLW